MTLDRILDIPDLEVTTVITYGDIPLKTLHVYSWFQLDETGAYLPGHDTYCGLPLSTALPEKQHFVCDTDIFGARPLWGDERMCPECAATARYQEQLAWYTLSELP